MDSKEAQINDLLARVSSLEQRERQNMDEILKLTKENAQLSKNMEAGFHKFDELHEKIESLRKNETAEGGASGKKLSGLKELEEKLKSMATDEKGSSSESKEGASVNIGNILTMKLLSQAAETAQSIFCAQLLTPQPLESQAMTIVNLCPSVLQSSSGYFHQESGTLKPKEEGVYSLGWKIHQAGDGKINFLLNVDGMSGMIFLGYTDGPGDVCSGSLVIPLKKGQDVGLIAKKMGGPDARIMSCNLMGWLMEQTGLPPQEKLTTLQEALYRPLKSDCQHL